MNKIVLVLGGARSGKSSFSEQLALHINSRYSKLKTIAYLATSDIVDEEFARRIKHHIERRGDNFTTYEETLDLMKLLRTIQKRHQVTIIECITTWLGNIFHKHFNASYHSEHIEKASLKTDASVAAGIIREFKAK